MVWPVIVASHRRSGTHLTIDTIFNNFPVFSGRQRNELMTLDHLSSHVTRWDRTVDEFREHIRTQPRILKTHCHGYLDDFFQGPKEIRPFIHDLFRHSRVIYIYRDCRDVMVSQFHYHHKIAQSPWKDPPTFTHYIRMNNGFDAKTCSVAMDRVSFWAYHVESWLCRPDVLYVTYEDLHRDYCGTLRRIALFIEQPLNSTIKDVRKKPSHKPQPVHSSTGTESANPVLTSVGFRKGDCGDWKDYFSRDDLAFFDARAGKLNRFLGYK
jgi:hypothetical protein